MVEEISITEETVNTQKKQLPRKSRTKDSIQKAKELKKDLLSFIFLKGTVYKEDFFLYGKSICPEMADDKESVNEDVRKAVKMNKLLKSLMAKGLVAEKTFTLNEVINPEMSKNKNRKVRKKKISGTSFRKQNVTLITITEDGLKEVRDSRAFTDEEYTAVVDSNKDLLSLTNYRKVAKELTNRHVECVLQSLGLGIPVDAINKPKLKDFYAYSYGGQSKDPKFPNSVIDELYTKVGIYYTHKEYIDFETASPETIRPSRAKGIYFRDGRCYVIYANQKGDDGLVFVKQAEAENELVYSISDRWKTIAKKNIFAMFLSDSMKAICDACEYRKDAEDDKARVNYLSANNTGIFNLEDEGAFNKYSNLYFFPNTKTGRMSAYYIFNIDARTELLNTNKHVEFSMVEDDIGMRVRTIYTSFEKQQDTLFTHTLNNTKCVFIHYLDAKKLLALKKEGSNYYVFTSPDLAEPIRKIIHKDVTIFNSGTLEPIDEETYIYDALGNIEGKQMIIDYLKNLDKKLPRKEFASLPQLGDKCKPDADYANNSVAFYNDIARGNLKITDVLKYVPQESYVMYNPKRYGRNDKYKVIRVVPSIYSKINAYARKHGITVTYAAELCLRYKEPKEYEVSENVKNESDEEEPENI